MKKVIECYNELYKKYGYSEKSLGWTKNKQVIRFEQLFRFLNPKKGKILDLGCGFGDLYDFIKKEEKYDDLKYIDVDIMDSFINEAMNKFCRESKDNCKFECCDFEEYLKETKEKYEYIIASGIFGYMLFENEEKQYAYIESVFEQVFEKCEEGFAMNFLSNKVDYRTSSNDFHADPARILSIAYKFSRNVILDNSIMPFEFCITLFKDDSFEVKDTVFSRYNALKKYGL